MSMVTIPVPLTPILQSPRERLICPIDGNKEHRAKIDSYNELVETIYQRELELNRLRTSMVNIWHEIVKGGQPLDAKGVVIVPPAPDSPLDDRYHGWMSEVVRSLEAYIDQGVDPRDHYVDLKEIAEGESGTIFSARLVERDSHLLRLSPMVKAMDKDDFAHGRSAVVAIKSVMILPDGSPKLKDLQHELGLLKGLRHDNFIALDALYLDFLEDNLWVRMELMERSLAEIIDLVNQGLVLQDRAMARLASDVLSGLNYLHQHGIAHRDVRSDNLLINKQGVLKLTDFASAVKVPISNPFRTEPAGVRYWQAPEVLSPPYNVLKVDVWSLGATIWEMAETEPPFTGTNAFADRWPPVSQPSKYSPAFHDFLHICSEPASSRPSPAELLESQFILGACGRPLIIQILNQCIAMED